ncbi:MAG TPA: alpha/beta fold hydrolase [Pseudonocardia sp.]|nr:alpha/beta fold hydrolase [Pseudonocardia sp.]
MPRTIDQLPIEIAAAYPYRSRFVQVNGWRMHYIDEGPADGPPVLLLHGNPAWGYLWRRTVARLVAAGYRVVVPDQIGFGLSEKPHDHRVHTLDNHAANLVALLDALDLRAVTFCCHDWGGPTGLSALLTRPERAAAVAVLSTWAWPDEPSPFHRRVVPWRLMHAPLTGPYLLGRRAAMPGRGMYLSVLDRAAFDERPYTEVLSDPDERALTWIWPRSIPLGEPSDRTVPRFEWLEREVARLDLPATVIWGREDDVFEPSVFAQRWHRLWPHAEGTHFVSGRHFVQEDSGQQIGELLVDFLDRRVRPDWKPAASRPRSERGPSATEPASSEPASGTEVAVASSEPDGCRAVPLLADHQLGHYPAFRDFLAHAFGSLQRPGVVSVGSRGYRLNFLHRSGPDSPDGISVDALVPGLEPLDETTADHDLWAILRWLVEGVSAIDERWSVEGLTTTGQIYRIPAAGQPNVSHRR